MPEPVQTPPETGSALANRLRGAIDSGHTHDKVGAADPAAAPLGVDEEAAGTPIPTSAARAALAAEVNGDAGRGRVDPHAPTDRRGPSWSLIAMIGVVIIIAALAYLALRR